jgi:hypothetical protein
MSLRLLSNREVVDTIEQADEDLAAEHAELRDWQAGQIAARLRREHFVNGTHGLVVEVLRLAEQVGAPDPVPPVRSTDEPPF